MLMIILFVVYQLIQLLLFPLYLPYTFIRNFNSTDTSTITKEESGYVPASDPSKHVFWIHGKGAEEIMGAQALIEEIKKEIPKAACYITSSSALGRKIARQKLKADYVSMLPHDNIASMALAFRRINPKSIIVLEHEVWPSMVGYAQFKKLPTYLLNAQVTGKTAINLNRYNFIYKDIFNTFDTIYAQSYQDKKQFETAGVKPHNILSIGNITAYNVPPKREIALRGQEDTYSQYKETKKTVNLLVGKIHEEEVEYYLELFERMKKIFPETRLILELHDAGAADSTVEKIKAKELSLFIWDEKNLKVNNLARLIPEVGQKIMVDHDILLVTVPQKLFILLGITDIYYPGGTFSSSGGGDILPAAVWAVPTILGPNDEQTREIADQLALRNGIERVDSQAGLQSATRRLLGNVARREAIGLQAQAWIMQQAKYVEGNLNRLIDRLLENVAEQRIDLTPEVLS